MPSGHDTELGTIFREMRRATGVSRERIAGRLATSVETIDILESGNLTALPGWQEVSRIVTAYSAQLGLDSRPILRRMKGQIDDLEAAGPEPVVSASDTLAPVAGDPPAPPPVEAPAVQPNGADERGSAAEASSMQPGAVAQDAPAAQGATHPQPSPVTTDEAVQGTETKGRAGRFIRAVVKWIVLLCFVGALGYGLWFASQNPKSVWGAVDSLPEPLPGMMRSAWELVRPLDQPEPRPQIFDPENRKSDKLP